MLRSSRDTPPVSPEPRIAIGLAPSQAIARTRHGRGQRRRGDRTALHAIAPGEAPRPRTASRRAHRRRWCDVREGVPIHCSWRAADTRPRGSFSGRHGTPPAPRRAGRASDRVTRARDVAGVFSRRARPGHLRQQPGTIVRPGQNIPGKVLKPRCGPGPARFQLIASDAQCKAGKRWTCSVDGKAVPPNRALRHA
jgi:hypothetical protein